jgi:hypothetical protein
MQHGEGTKRQRKLCRTSEGIIPILDLVSVSKVMFKQKKNIRVVTGFMWLR